MTLVKIKKHGNEILGKLVQKINFLKDEIMGSFACKIASIVRAEIDIYICISLHWQNPPKDWDFTLPESILKAAGGVIINLEIKIYPIGKKVPIKWAL